MAGTWEHRIVTKPEPDRQSAAAHGTPESVAPDRLWRKPIPALMLLLVLQITPPVHALNPEKPLSQFVHRNWQMSDGLPQNSVNDITQDPSGRLWIATFGGVATFDGFQFQDVPLRAAGAPVDIRILRVSCDRDGTIWIGTESGQLLALRDGKVSLELNAPGRGGVALLQDSRGSLSWYVTSGDFFCRNQGRFERFGPPPDAPLGYILDAQRRNGGTMVVAGTGGVFTLSPHGVERFREVPPGLKVTCMLWKPGGTGFLGTKFGLYRLDRQDRPVRLTPPMYISRLFEDRHGTLWIGTLRHGLWRYNGKAIEQCPETTGLASGSVRVLFEDDEGDLWAGTAGSGLHQLVDGPAVTVLGRDAPRSVTAVAAQGDRVWAALGCEGLALVDRSGEVTLRSTVVPGTGERLCVQSLHSESDGGLLVGGWSSTIFRLGPAGLTPRTRLPASVAVVRAMIRDDAGGLLLGTASGLFRLEGNTPRLIPGTRDLSFHVLVRAGKDRILAGSDGGILELSRTNPTRTLVPSGALAGAPVRALLPDDSETLWIGTYGAGLFVGRHGRILPIGTETGLPGRTVSAIVRDRFGWLWLTGNRGVIRVARDALLRAADGEKSATSLPCRRFSKQDGLPSAECNGGGTLPAWLDAHDRLWVPTIKGLAVIDTRPLPSRRLPRPFIAGARLDGEPIPLSRLEQLPSDASNLEIRYGAIRLRNPTGLRFRYRLEGYDSRWTDAGTQRTAIYREIPKGRLRFRLQVKEYDGPWVEVRTGVPIHRAHRFSETILFPLLLASTGGVLVALLFLGRLRAATRYRERLTKAVQQATAERDRLAELVARTNEGQSLPEVLDYLFEASQVLLPCDRIGYAVVENGTVRAVWARSRAEGIRLDVGYEMPLEETTLARLGRENRTRIIEDLEAHMERRPDSTHTRLIVEEGMRSSLTVPLLDGSRVVGFLFFNATKPRIYTADHARQIHAVGAQLSMIIQKSRLADDLERANTRLTCEAATDHLTGLSNRRSFTHHLQREWLRLQRQQLPLAIAYCDIDHFKAYNDLYGHAQGDRCLEQVAGILARYARRPGDLAVRLGGEEFGLLLSGGSLLEMFRIAEEFRRSVLDAGIPHEASPTAAVVTASIGVAACVPGEVQSPEDLLRWADRAMYRAKAQGRNRVVRYDLSTQRFEAATP